MDNVRTLDFALAYPDFISPMYRIVPVLKGTGIRGAQEYPSVFEFVEQEDAHEALVALLGAVSSYITIDNVDALKRSPLIGTALCKFSVSLGPQGWAVDNESRDSKTPSFNVAIFPEQEQAELFCLRVGTAASMRIVSIK